MKFLFALDRLLARLESFLLISIFIVMLCFASLQVILRNFFDTGIGWADVFARHLVLWIGFFGATLATKEEKHIRIDALTKFISPKYLPLVEMAVSVFSLTVAIFLTLAARKFVLDEKAIGEHLFANLPTWVAISIMPVGFGIIAFRFLIKFLEQLYKFSGRSVPQPSAVPAVSTGDSNEIEISVKIRLP